MAGFSGSDAALSGFRFIARHPKTIGIWTLVFLIYELVWGAALLAFAGDQLPALRALSQTSGDEAQSAWSVLPGASLVMLSGLSALLFVFSLMFTAAYRTFLHPHDDRFGYVRVGKDELRFAVLIVLWVVLAVGGSLVVAFIGGLLAALGGLMPQPLKAIWELLVGLAALAVYGYVLVRLCFSMPMTLEDRHVRLLESWKATRHNFWTLLGVFLLTAVLILVLLLLVCSILAVCLIVAMAVGLPRSSFMEGLSSVLQMDMSSLAAYFSPTSLIAAVLNAFIVSVGIAILTSPVAEAYLAWTQSQSAEAPTVH
jgi:hypothetical protein